MIIQKRSNLYANITSKQKDFSGNCKLEKENLLIGEKKKRTVE